MTTPPSSQRFEVTPNAATHFAWLRTRLSAERTLMSWMRTSIALIGFGFTIVQVFERFRTMPGVRAEIEPHSARYFGLTLIAIGTLALCVSVWQYERLLRYLWTNFSSVAGVEHKIGRTPTALVAICLILVGLLVFVGLIARMV